MVVGWLFLYVAADEDRVEIRVFGFFAEDAWSE
jgi:hypothetical protein